ncbi:codanin-1-like [Mytilus galloprovincialis]|uniref:codanin-1-like n=1 Tax=Mytilus galloprovincialis TaxID=29158 RepID=UPI003F7C9DCF
MAAVLDLLLKGEITPNTVVHWIKFKSYLDSSCGQLQDFGKLQQEFVPFFLNYLRDQTLHLLQSSRSAANSPAKTPSAQKLKKSLNGSSKSESGKRVQLFGASPGDGLEDIKSSSASVFSPNVSFDSPSYLGSNKHSSDVKQKGRSSLGGSSSKNVHNAKYQSDAHKSKQKFSLGEFISPEVTKKKNSPYSSSSKNRSIDNSPSPAITQRSGGRRKHSLDPNDLHQKSPAPVFSLASVSDFPPMGGEPGLAVRASMNMLESPNFEMGTPRPTKNIEITKSRRISFTTLQTEPKTPTRRINPTQVTGGQQNKVFLEAEEKVNNKPTNGEILEPEKELLRLEREKILKDFGTDVLVPMTPTKPGGLERLSSIVEVPLAEMSKVTHTKKLDILANIYSSCLKENLLPNIIVELYFIIQLLTSKSSDLDLINDLTDDIIDENYFTSIHNAVYFSVKVLENQLGMLQHIDKGTLRLLAENQRLVNFSPRLAARLKDLCNDSADLCGPVYPRSPIGSVSFQAETDNRKNFPNDRTFHLFKKQRDAFYELLREWETNHHTPGWTISGKMGDRIRALVSYKTELANHLHFARLFQSQLISMCKGDGSIRMSGDEDNILLLSQLKQANPEKFKRLQERFIKPSSSGGPCPEPSFPGCQEFFHKFIVAASCPVFNQHLTNTFVGKVSELNSTDFESTLSEETETEQESDEDQKEKFISILLTLKLVGKFLGFVTFLPYKNTSKLPDDTEAAYMALRKHEHPPIDLHECLRVAVYMKHLTLTVPWVVEFLSMMDLMAPNLDYYQLVLCMLLFIHRFMWEEMTSSNTYYSHILVITMISWLLENAVIPEGYFFSDIPESVQSILSKSSKKSDQTLDAMGFIDQKLYYTCCPYVGEIKTLLVEFAIGTSNKTATIRKITPVSAETETPQSVTDRQIQLQLEENFFHNHPASMKRIVDFVAERTASNFIKKFRSAALQKSIASCRIALQKLMESYASSSPSSKAKDKHLQDIVKLSMESVSKLKSVTFEDASRFCKIKVEAIIPLLLPEEQTKAVIAMSADISRRLAEERISQWINKHITANMYQNDLQAEYDKILKRVTNPTESCQVEPVKEPDFISVAKQHDDNVRHPSEVLIDLKEVVRELFVKGHHVEWNKVSLTLMEVKDIINNRQDVIPSIYNCLGRLVFDLAVSLVANDTDKWEELQLELFMSLWKQELKPVTPFNRCICAFIVQLLEDSKNPSESWKKYSHLLATLLKEELLTCEVLEKSFLSLISHNQKCLENLSYCIQCITESLEDTEIDCDFSEVTDWLLTLSCSHNGDSKEDTLLSSAVP